MLNLFRSGYSTVAIARCSAALVLLACLVFAGCTKMDDYKEKFIHGDLNYTAKPDTVIIFSGKNRAQVTYLLSSDPNIKRSVIYWDGRTDSVQVNVNRTKGVDTLVQIVNNLQEGAHTFELVNIDGAGNRSVPVFATGTVYGDRYQESLFNRAIASSFLDADLEVNLTWANADASSGVFGTEIRYLNNMNDTTVVFLPVDESVAALTNFKKGSSIAYSTMYRPDSTSIDSFSSAAQYYEPQVAAQWVNLTSKLVQNAGNPFAYSSWDGSRWGVLDKWISSPSANGVNGFGSFEVKGSSTLIAMEGGWGRPAINNGKIFQAIALPYAGTWRFSVRLNALNDAGTKYIVAATGNGIPDVTAAVAGTLARYEFSGDSGGSTINIVFTVNAPQVVSVGFLANMPDSGSYFECNYVNLEYYYN